MFDDTAREVGLHFDGHLNQLVEMVGTDLEHPQHPGEGPAISRGLTVVYIGDRWRDRYPCISTQENIRSLSEWNVGHSQWQWQWALSSMTQTKAVHICNTCIYMYIHVAAYHELKAQYHTILIYICLWLFQYRYENHLTDLYIQVCYHPFHLTPLE